MHSIPAHPFSCFPYLAILLCAGFAGCGGGPKPAATPSSGQFASDLAFLRQHTTVVLLADPASGAQVAVAPGYQGRVMTSTTGGADAPSFGWIGRAAIESGQRQPHMNVFGGEDRFWLGPEGGQYALYFKPGDPFDLEHWQTPEPFDWGLWAVESESAASVRFRKRMTLVNYSGTQFDLEVDRTVRLLSEDEIKKELGETPGAGVRTVAFESSNTVTNVGKAPWQPASGLISVWILGQFTPSPETTIAIPFTEGSESTLGPPVNDAYFGKVPADRLIVKSPAVFFKADGQYRSKIGLSQSRAQPVAGSYDATAHVLTVLQYTRPPDRAGYVNSMWETQREPYKGDVINSYNDGPPAPGKPPLGPFYEIETSSPALDLSPGKQYTHVHRTFHLVGPEADLDRIAHATLKVGIADMVHAFTSSAAGAK
ncbi:MAG: DUF6786 family protein [Acidobacteriota bacterium]